MTENITDTYNFTIDVAQTGNLIISEVVHPDIVEPGVAFDITYNVTNTGGTDEFYGYIVDAATDTEIAGTRWQATLEEGDILPCTATISGIATKLNGRIVVGYIS